MITSVMATETLRQRTPYTQEEIRSNRRKVGAGLAAAALATAGVLGLNQSQDKEVNRYNVIEKQAIKEAGKAANALFVFKAGVAVRSAPVMDNVEGAEPTLDQRVAEGKVLVAHRPLITEAGGKRWAAFVTREESGQKETRLKPNITSWVNISDLNPENNYEVFNYKVTDRNNYVHAGPFIPLDTVRGAVPGDVAWATVQDAEKLFNETLTEYALSPVPLTPDTPIGTALKRGPKQ